MIEIPLFRRELADDLALGIQKLDDRRAVAGDLDQNALAALGVEKPDPDRIVLDAPR